MASPAPTVLVIEDEPQIRRFLRATLPAHGYRLLEAETGRDGLTQAAMHKPELIILDLGLPDLDGLEVTRRLREWTTVPILVLSARGQETDKVVALDAGADDYLTKPFGIQELLARMRVALRHAAHLSQEPREPVFTVGELRVDLAHRHVYVANQEIHLKPGQHLRYAGVELNRLYPVYIISMSNHTA
jgi:two-component system KDP operon response regulator KdpE